MFVEIALPLVDVRQLLPTSTGRINVPLWEDPEYGDEFVRGLGRLRPRPRRGVTPWVGEGHFIDAHRAIQFPPTRDSSGIRCSVVPVYRRYFSDGTTSRLEVGFRPRSRSRMEDIRSATGDAALLPVHLRAESPHRSPLVKLGPRLARYLLSATTCVRHQPAAVNEWWVQAGAPVIVTEITLQELSRSSNNAHEQVASELQDRDAAVLLEQNWTPFFNGKNLDQSVSSWSVVAGPGAARSDIRALRVHILRSHAELEAFRCVLRLCRRGRLDVAESQSLRDYLDVTSDLLLRRSFGGFPNKELLERVLETIGETYADELVAIDRLMSAVRSRGLARRLEDVAGMLQTQGKDPRFLILGPPEGIRIIVNVAQDNRGQTLINGSPVIGALQGGIGTTQEVKQVTQS